VVECLARRLDGPVDVLGLAVRDLGEHLLGGRVDRLERLTRRGLDPLSVDQKLVLRANESVSLLFAGYGNRHCLSPLCASLARAGCSSERRSQQLTTGSRGGR